MRSRSALINILIIFNYYATQSESTLFSTISRNGFESCPLGPGLMQCPPNHQIWTCYCPTRNDSLVVNCAAIGDTFCPEPSDTQLGSRIGAAEGPKNQMSNEFTKGECVKFINQQCFLSRWKFNCICNSAKVEMTCGPKGVWTTKDFTPLSCPRPPTAITFPAPGSATREPKIQNKPQSDVKPEPFPVKPPPAPFPGPDPENADHETKYGDYDAFNQMNFNQPSASGQNGGRRTTRRPSTSPVAATPLGAGCKKPMGLIVGVALLAVALAVVGGVLLVVLRKYKQALQQIIHMNNLYSTKGIDKGKTLPVKHAQVDEKNQFKFSEMK